MYEKYLSFFYNTLPLGEAFDLLERKVMVGGRHGVCFFVDGLTDGELMQRVMDYLMKVKPEDMEGITTSQQFIATHMPFLDTTLAEPQTQVPPETGEKSQHGQDAAPPRNPREWSRQQLFSACRLAETRLYSGLVPLMIEGLDKIIIIDARSYPSRSVEEPQKEKSLRGAKDGFTEGFMTNIALIRRRLRDSNLIFTHFTIGKISRTDVAIAYMKDKADRQLVEKISGMLKRLEGEPDMDALTVGDQSLLEKILLSEARTEKKGESTGSGEAADSSSHNAAAKAKITLGGRLNPFPKVRYSQRPDIISAHIAEGKVAIIVDNSPTVMLVPVGIFDFLQDVDDYYFPQVTGNYFRLLRIVNFVVILFGTPVYMVLVENQHLTPEVLRFFVPDENYAIPLFWQFILLEISVDALKLASLNTPESLGMSLSVIGALILGQFSIDSGWFIPQTILCMAVVALAGFTQPSIELSYSIKFSRIAMLAGAYVLGVWGIVLAAGLSFLIMAFTRTLTGGSYLYPLIPFRWDALKRLIFRTSM